MTDEEAADLRAQNAALVEALARCPPEKPHDKNRDFAERVATWWRLWARPVLTDTRAAAAEAWERRVREEGRQAGLREAAEYVRPKIPEPDEGGIGFYVWHACKNAEAAILALADRNQALDELMADSAEMINKEPRDG